MINSKNQAFTTFLLSLTLLLLGIGCRKNSLSYVPNPNSFSINVIGSESIYSSMWIVIGSADGTAVRAVRRVEGPGLVDFGEIGTEAMSISIVCIDNEGSASVNSYLNIYGGTWTFVLGSQEVIGTASVTLHFPPMHYDAYEIQLPYGGFANGLANTLSDTATELTTTVNFYRFEADNQLSIFADLWAYTFHRYGWIVAQPFQAGQVNNYVIEMDQPVPVRTFTFSRPLWELTLYALREPYCSKYSLTSASTESFFGETNLELAVPAFPADKWRLAGFGRSISDDYYYEWIGPQPPTDLAIPNGSVAAICNASEPSIEQVSVSGAADAITALFVFLDESNSCSWSVSAPSNTHSIKPIALPDSIRTAIRIDELPLWTAGIEIDDYDTASDYDGFIDIEHRFDLYSGYRYNTLYQSYRCLYE